MFFKPQSAQLPIWGKNKSYSQSSQASQAQLAWLSKSENLGSDARDVLESFLDNQIQNFGMYDYPPSRKDWEAGIKDLIHLQQAITPNGNLGELSTTSEDFMESNRDDFTLYNPNTDQFVYPPSRRLSTGYEGGAKKRSSRKSKKSKTKRSSKKKSKAKKSRSRK